MIEILLTLIVGLLLGFFGRSLYDNVKGTFNLLLDKFDAHRAGVVKPSVAKATKAQPIDLTAHSGVIRRPSPNEVALSAMEAREERLKNAR